eukprot:gb/GFBE01035582.1/.p1 GENE.gb/GFBE01035582.1/~~gb/GFBE01035582.1/.p1  ORF type:complete len:309 (+),score=84.37 gb/GFBE01035582.1/:1-927(+)
MYALYPSHEEEQLVSQVEDMEQQQSDSEQPARQQVGRVVRNSLIAATVFGVVGLAGLHLSGSKALHSSLGGIQGKSGAYGSLSSFPTYNDAASAASALATQTQQTVSSQINSVNQLTGGVQQSVQASNNPLAVQENLNDGNTCEDDEEVFMGLCYKQCKILTNGAHPVRISSFGCAKSKSLGDIFGSQMESLIPCQGFDISGDEAGNGCPHDEGACLADEEISLGKCYKKCSALTDGMYPHRTTATTCCKSEGVMDCFNPANVKFNPSFSVGGGSNSRESRPHGPERKYTEAGTEGTAPAFTPPPSIR